ncbi:hypothetical protein ACUIAJ_03940 [Dermabacteraceae bacterium CCM 9519]
MTATPKFTALPPAKFHPDPDPERYWNEAEEIRVVAGLLGIQLMPWQYKALECATEYTEAADGSRHYRYSHVLISVPRQSGKTTLVGPVQLHRLLTRGRSPITGREEAACWYTAQSGQDARRRVLELLELITESELTDFIGTQRANGGEGAYLRANRACHITRFSPTVSALHGEHPHLVTLDEIWHFDKTLGEAILNGAIEPAQVTLGALAQVWQISTMGTHKSEYMNDLVEKGRAGNPKMCYIEYSAPENVDPLQPDVAHLWHPAVGNTITVEAINERAENARGDAKKVSAFLRGYANLLTATESTLVDMSAWDDHEAVITPPADQPVKLAFEVAPGDEFAAIVLSWESENGPVIMLTRQAPGTRWLIKTIKELREKMNVDQIAADGAGPVTRYVRRLEQDEIEVRTLKFQEYGQACETLFTAVDPADDMRHDGDQLLREQIAALEVKHSNGVRRINRDGETAVPAAIAAAIALYAHKYPEPDTEEAAPPLLASI